MTDEEIDQLLARYDQTEPALQRKIVAKFVQDRAMLETIGHELVELVSRPRLSDRDRSRAKQIIANFYSVCR